MSNKPLSKQEWAEYWAICDKQERDEYLRNHTYVVIFKVLCPACSYNASQGKKIIYDCPNCFAVKWHNCSIRQITNGELADKIQRLHPTVEWIKAYDNDRKERWSWKRHESQYEQDAMGHWVPKH